AAKEKKESQNKRRNALQNAFKKDESISVIGRSTHNTSVFKMKMTELAPEMTKVHSLEEYTNLSSEDKTKTTYLSIYGTGEEAKNLIKKLGDFSQFPNLIAMSISGDLNIPKAIFKLKKLKFLSIGNDQLEISPLIGKLTNLELLEFKYKYYTLPNEIKHLSKLKYFRAHFKISYDPSALFSLTNLKALHLEVNRKENLEGIGNLKDLEYLQISHEHPEINQLTKLKALKIERVKNAPFENLKNLETIIISSNTIESMPESLTKLPKLAFIYSKNLKRLKVIPESYGTMPALKYYFDSYYGDRPQISIPEKLANMEHYVEYSSN
ncbi:MAG: hypothetical protein P1U56_22825, partial [Saprospiraceae bacterium]|nr:hypothetical protein [Saprospiraceae bacterium]